MSSYADDPDMVELVVSFVSGLALQVTQLENAHAEGDLETARRIAHQLKGAAGGYGFDEITRAAADLEQAMKVLTHTASRRASLEGPPSGPSAAERASADEQLRVLTTLCRRARAA